MDFNKKQPALLYLDRNGFYFYESTLGTVVSLGFLPTSVRDLDVINPIELENQIKAWVTQSKISPAVITIILSPNIIFEKDIVVTNPADKETQVQTFLDALPFESVSSNYFPIEKGVKVLGVNEGMYLALKAGFEKLGSSVDSVIPYHALGTDNALVNNLTPENASELLKRVDKLKQYSFLKVQPKPQSTATASTKAAVPKKKRLRLYMMIGFLTVLLLVLGYLITTVL